MGGASGGARDAQMAELIKKYLPKALDAQQRAADRQGRQVAHCGACFGDLAEERCADTRRKAGNRRGRGTRRSRNPGRLRANRSRLRKRLTKKLRSRLSRPMLLQEPQPKIAPTPRPKAEVDPISTVVHRARGLGDPGRLLAERKRSKGAPRQDQQAGSEGRGIGIAFHRPLRKRAAPPTTARVSAASASKTAAWDACGALKKKKIACYAVEQ